ncbi:MAG: hypothetical protein CMM58_13050 [Rhodospirillaceae bacterium]|nr:hypothetical protein [Rhodospirillaceae bacterium]
MVQRCVLVTGSSSGIGRAISETLLEAGYKVVGIARDQSKFKPANRDYYPYTIDLSNLDKATTVIKSILRQHNEISVLISNAGYGKFQPIENFSQQQIEKFLDLNLTIHILICQLLVRHLKRRSGGNIIIMGSEAGLSGKRKSTLYSAAKFGLRGFSQALRDEVSSKDISVSLINPGFVRTPFFNEIGFRPGEDNKNAIEALDVARVVANILEARPGTVVEEVNMSPARKVIKFDKDIM